MIAKKRGSLMLPLMILLLFITTALAMVMSIRKSNLLQYQILEDAYRMNIMLELSCLELHNALAQEQSSGEYLNYQIPTRINFPQGVVVIDYDAKAKVKELGRDREKHIYKECELTAQLTNGRIKKSKYYIELLPSETIQKDYQIIED